MSNDFEWMNPRKLEVNSTVQGTVQSTVSQLTFYELWTTDDYIHKAHLALLLIEIAIFVLYIYRTIYFYYFVRHNRLSQLAAERRVDIILKKKE